MYRLGLKLWSDNTGAYLREAERLFSQGVFSYVELFVVPESMNTLDAWRRLHVERGVPFIVHNAHAAAGFNLADRTAEASNRNVYAQTKRFADALDARYVIFHGGIDGTIEETARQLKALGEPRALLENKPFVPLPNKVGAKFCRGATVEEIGYVLRETGCGFCLDVGHAVCAAASQGLEPYAYVGELARRFSPAMFHLSDVMDMSSQFDAHPHLGTGALDIARLWREVFLPDALISIETVKDSTADLDDFIQDARYMENV
jgi:sugar phosphate isomerase/epimerase